MELWFAFENGFSGQILFEKWTIAIYNIGFTLLPPIAIGIFDQHLSAATLMNVPHLYKSGQKRKHFNTKVFWSWTVNAIYHSLLLFWLPLQGTICLPLAAFNCWSFVKVQGLILLHWRLLPVA